MLRGVLLNTDFADGDFAAPACLWGALEAPDRVGLGERSDILLTAVGSPDGIESPCQTTRRSVNLY